MNIKYILNKYNLSELTIATIGSHSALDICRGAKDAGFRTLVVAEPGRDKVYGHYYKTENGFGCVDQCLIVDKFRDLLTTSIQKKLIDQNTIFIPHRSFEVYLDFDYEAIEKKFRVPVFGNRYLLQSEERGRKQNQYYLLGKAGIRYPRQFKNPKEIDRLCLVKVLEKERKFERAFFLVQNYDDYKRQAADKIKRGLFTAVQLKKAVIEEFVLGVQVNFNFFYSPITKKLELMGTDTRRQTNIEGILKIPVNYQREVLDKVTVKYEEAGHMAVTVLESMLEKAYELGEKFVKVSDIIGPFALQSIIIAGPPKKDIVVVDVSPRMPGSPGIAATPYSRYLYGRPLSVGDRVAMEIQAAAQTNCLEKILT